MSHNHKLGQSIKIEPLNHNRYRLTDYDARVDLERGDLSIELTLEQRGDNIKAYLKWFNVRVREFVLGRRLEHRLRTLRHQPKLVRKLRRHIHRLVVGQ